MCARRFALALWLGYLLLSCPLAQALDSSNVLVLYNQASSDGLAIANYYAQVHPGVRLLGISGIGTSEDISADTYLSTVRPQVLSALNGSTDVIVTTKGMPLRVNVTETAPTAPWPSLPSYTDPTGVNRTILSWKSYSSLESELTAIDTVSSWQMMGDQSYSISGHFSANPYYKATSEFSHADTGTRLTARLDGYTVSDVEAAINRAQNAFIGPLNTPSSSSGPIGLMVDNDPTKAYDPTMASLVNSVAPLFNVPVTADNTTAFITTANSSVIGYVSHGVNQASTPSNYVSALNISLANGAVFDTWESYNAYSFNPGGAHSNQGSIAQWLQKGGTAGVGNVEEPGANISSVTNEDQMFAMLLAGRTFAEAAWSATKQLSYVNTVVGDPLMTWKELTFGDVNLDGHVDNTDLAIMGTHWGETVPNGGLGWTYGDMNGDGVVNMSDLMLLTKFWGSVSDWADGSTLPRGQVAFAAPEPSSLCLLSIGILGFACLARRKNRRFLAKPARP